MRRGEASNCRRRLHEGLPATDYSRGDISTTRPVDVHELEERSRNSTVAKGGNDEAFGEEEKRMTLKKGTLRLVKTQGV